MKQRLQKLLAAAGYGSRRSCEEMILDGRVTVNGQRLLTLPALADPDVDAIRVDNRPLQAEQPAYYILNKPAGVFCTNHDPSGRRRAIDLLPGVTERVFPVGRLEADSMGLLLFTNDGPLAQKLTHPRFGVSKTYRVEASGQIPRAVLEKLRAGVWLSEGRTRQATINVIHSNKDRTILDVILRESRNREIRRMLAKFGHNVRRVVRVSLGKISITKLPIGAYRRLTQDEVKHLHSLAKAVPAQESPQWKPAPKRQRPASRSAVKSPRPRTGAAAPAPQAGPRRTILHPVTSSNPRPKRRP